MSTKKRSKPKTPKMVPPKVPYVPAPPVLEGHDTRILYTVETGASTDAARIVITAAAGEHITLVVGAGRSETGISLDAKAARRLIRALREAIKVDGFDVD